MPDYLQTHYRTPSRQIHLSFHNHELVTDLGGQFDAELFARTLKGAYVESITCFARCYYGWLYYNSQRFHDRVHPNLAQRNLLEQQIEACHRHGLKVSVSTPLQRDALSARRHPEWRAVAVGNNATDVFPKDSGIPSLVCVNAAYRSFFRAHLAELLADLPLDGLVLDGGELIACACARCQADMDAKGLNPDDSVARHAYALKAQQAFLLEIVELVRAERPGARLAFSGLTLDAAPSSVVAELSHLEFDVQRRENPNGAFALTSLTRREHQSGLDCVGLTSRFHGGPQNYYTYRSQADLAFECVGLFSQGFHVMIGDHLPPSGRLDPHAYKQIGAVFADLALKEPWARNAETLAEIGVLDPAPFGGASASLHGCVRMLQQGAYQFHIVGAATDFEEYAVLILPDNIVVDAALSARLESYLARGGRILASFTSGMDVEKTAFALRSLGVHCSIPALGSEENRTQGDYLLPRILICEGLPHVPHHMDAPAVRVAPLDGADILADLIPPQFELPAYDFGLAHQAPPADQSSRTAIVATGNTVYFAHSIFNMVAESSPPWVKTLFFNALQLLLPEPLLRHDGPSTLRATLTAQDHHNRWLVHLQHDTRGVEGPQHATLEEDIPLYEVKLAVRVPQEVRQVAVRPQHYDRLEFWEAGNHIEFIVPRIEGHTMIAVEFK